ncbi:MAG: radical SAM protein, partial [Nitrososphaerales archaeon]
MISILILLINPPDRSEIRRSLNLRAPPLGLLYIAAALEKAGFPTHILDANLYNLSDLQIEREISKRSPDIVGVTATTNLIKEAEKIVTIAKKVLPDVITVIGGAHVTFLPIRTLNECPALDIVVIGEGEETIVELTKVLDQIMRQGGKYNSNQTYSELSKVKGIAYRLRNNQDEIKVTPPRPLITDLDKLPFPARHLVHYEHYGYLNRSILVGTLITSRGCPYSCTYCSSSLLAGKRFRSRSADNILDEIEFLYTKYKIRRFEFLDDIFTLNQKRAFEFARKVRERGLDISWEASSRVDTITKELLHELCKSGLSTIYYG